MVDTDVSSSNNLALARLKKEAAAERRIWWGFFLFGLGFLVAFLAMVAAMTWNAHDDHLQRRKAAVVCAQAGNIWTREGDCLITRKAG